ncbi:hypothetical protein CEXT_7041, partial [Caerostris extrusa]
MFRDKKSTCLMTAVSQYSTDFVCGGDMDFFKCLQRGAKECDVLTDHFVQDMIHTYKAACTEGTEMNT